MNNIFEICYPELKVALLADNLTKRILDTHSDFGFSSVRTQILLHLPFYGNNEVFRDDIFDRIYPQIINQCLETQTAHLSIKKDAGILYLDKRDKVKGRNKLILSQRKNTVIFKKVDTPVANDINKRLHYIHQDRDDTVVSYGLFLEGLATPFACASFSLCSRTYQLKSLKKFLNIDINHTEYIVMTRAYSVDNAPKNSMSKLFDLSCKEIRKNYPQVKVIITALNHYLGFKGSVFLGASYKPYALSPMEYWYDKKGKYVPRNQGWNIQKSVTPPIIWLVRGVYKDIHAIIEIEKRQPTVISKEEYKYGLKKYQNR